MTKDNTTRPKATAEVIKEFEDLRDALQRTDPADGNLKVLTDKYTELEESYDWFNIEYTDPTTGKKGMKDVAGKLVVPACYDGFYEFRSYLHSPYAPVIAFKEGKYGIVRGDGSGQILCEFKFDSISHMDFTSLYIARWDGNKEYFGVIATNGDVICPNILTLYYEPFNGIVIIESNKKLGVIDLDTYQCVLPEYDNLDADPDEYIVFHKDGQEWYITDEGERITKEQFENDEKYADAYCLNTFI